MMIYADFVYLHLMKTIKKEDINGKENDSTCRGKTEFPFFFILFVYSINSHKPKKQKKNKKKGKKSRKKKERETLFLVFQGLQKMG